MDLDIDLKKARIFILEEECSKELFQQLNKIFVEVAKAGIEEAETEGVVPLRKYTTRAFVEIENRYFRFDFHFYALPSQIVKQDITEVDSSGYDNGIQRELNKENAKTEWKQIDTD